MADISIDGLCQCAAVSSSRNGGSVAEDAWDHFECGVAWAQIGAYEQALEAWRQALRVAPDLAEASAAMGSAYMSLGCWHEAVRSYQRAIQSAPHLLESYYGLGSAYGRLGDFARAIETYELAFQLLPHGHALNQQADATSLEYTAQEALRGEPVGFQNRLRSDTEGFDFSALLSSPTARRHAARQEQG